MVKFKSIPEMYHKEYSGTKPNTVRKIDENDDRFKILYECESNLIEIENTETGSWFQRKITDVSVWKGLMIISWEHDESLVEHNNQKKLNELNDALVEQEGKDG